MERNNLHHKKNIHNYYKQANFCKRNEINHECEKLFDICSKPLYFDDLWDNYLKISNILEKIKILENVETNYLPRVNAIDEFIVWLKQNGAKIRGVSIQEFPDYDLGLQAEIDFTENDLILKIPKNLIFNVHTAAKEMKEIENDTVIKHMPNVGLAIALLVEKNKDTSDWKPFLNILPKNYQTVLYMNINDLQELKGSYSFEVAVKQCRNIARQYAYFNKIFQSSKDSVSNLLRDKFTYEEYRWAVSTVMTRQNIIPNEDNIQKVHSLIPMWDLCNHENGKITTNFNTTSGYCECYAMKNFNAGDQIFIHYGSRSNFDFFINSGFIYINNKNDHFKLRLGISKVDHLQEERKVLLMKVGIPFVHDYIIKPETKPISESLLAFLRILNMDKSQLDYWIKCNKIYDIFESDCLIFKDLDKIVAKFIVTRLKLLLSKYPSLEKNDLPSNETTSKTCKELILQMITIERKLLESIIAILENEVN